MPSFNTEATGQTIRVNFNQDISAGTSFEMVLEPQTGEKLTKTATLGTSNVIVDDETYLANKYIEYVIIAGDFDQTGRWQKKGNAVISTTNTIYTNYSFFRVMP